MTTVAEASDERVILSVDDSVDDLLERLHDICDDRFDSYAIEEIEVTGNQEQESFQELSKDVIGIVKKRMSYQDGTVRFRIRSDDLGINLSVKLFPGEESLEETELGPANIDGLATDSMTVVGENDAGGPLTEEGKDLLLRLAEA